MTPDFKHKVSLKLCNGQKMELLAPQSKAETSYLPEGFETRLSSAIQPESTIIECGAGFGALSFMLASHCQQGFIYSFEPANTFSYLLENIRATRTTNIVPISGKMVDAETYKTVSGENVYETTTIDDFAANHPVKQVDVIAVNTASNAFSVLKGAKHIIHRCSPLLLVSIEPTKDPSENEVLKWLFDQGYDHAEVYGRRFYIIRKTGSALHPGMELIFMGDADQANVAPDTSITDNTEMGPCDDECVTVDCDGKQISIPVAPSGKIAEIFGFDQQFDASLIDGSKPFDQWKMEVDDAPMFRYMYRNFKPSRHLEFGTWQGQGVLYVLEECNATVWTINLPAGLKRENGQGCYGNAPNDSTVQAWAKKLGLIPRQFYHTDTYGFIGRMYLEKDLGSRVCQIYSDSTKWDTSNYPEGFFDSALIDGGHTKEIVSADTKTAFSMVRPGGLVLWHDFSPNDWQKIETSTGVMRAIAKDMDFITANTTKLFWLKPAWILAGIKK